MKESLILIVEDEIIVADNIQFRLKTLGYSVLDIAVSSEQAINIIKKDRPDLALVDIKLEGKIDGIELAEKIKARYDIPVVYLTAYSDQETLSRAKITEPYGYIVKPFAVEELHSNIEMALYKHKIENKLRESEELHREALENISDAIFITNNKGDFTYICGNASTIFGYSVLELEKQGNIIELIGRPAFSKIKKLSNIGEKSFFDVKIRDNFNNMHDLSVIVKRVKIGGGTLLFTFHDISDRIIAEENLRKSEEKLELIFNESLDVIIVIDAINGKVIKANKSIKTDLGYVENKILNKHYSVLFDKNSNYKPKDIIDGIFESVDIKRADGSILPMDITTSMINWEKTAAILVSLRDASERKENKEMITRNNEMLQEKIRERTSDLEKAKNELDIAYKKEKELSELKSHFISLISHEYKTPLTIASSSAEMLRASLDKGNINKAKNHIDKIEASLQTLSQMIDDVLTYKRLSDADLYLEYSSFDIIKLIKRVSVNTKSKDNSEHEIKVQCKQKSMILHSDKKLVEQVIRQLLSNAVKYSSEDSEIIINIENNNKEIVISFQDKGKKILKEVLEHIFEPFNKEKKDIGIKHSIGLKLPLVKQIISILSGKIEIDSNENTGTKIRVTLNNKK